MFKNGIQMLAEMAKDDRDHSVEDLTAKMAGIKFSDILKDMQKVKCNEVALPKEAVLVRSCERLGLYLVEMGDISKYMQDNEVRNFKEAIHNIAECNDKDESKFALVVDEDAINDMIEEAQYAAKCPDEEYAKVKMESVLALEKAWEIIGNQGVKMVRM